MKQNSFGKGSIYRRQDGRWVVAVCSRDPVTGKSIRRYSYGSTKLEALQKKMDLLAKSEEPFVTPGLTVRSI